MTFIKLKKSKATLVIKILLFRGDNARFSRKYPFWNKEINIFYDFFGNITYHFTW